MGHLDEDKDKKNFLPSTDSVSGTRRHRFVAVRRDGDAFDASGVAARRRYRRPVLAPPPLHHELRREALDRRQLRSARLDFRFFTPLPSMVQTI